MSRAVGSELEEIELDRGRGQADCGGAHAARQPLARDGQVHQGQVSAPAAQALLRKKTRLLFLMYQMSFPTLKSCLSSSYENQSMLVEDFLLKCCGLLCSVLGKASIFASSQPITMVWTQLTRGHMHVFVHLHLLTCYFEQVGARDQGSLVCCCAAQG
jgi:hypothetical protein